MWFSYLASITVCAFLGLFVSLRRGPGIGIGAALALSLLVPTWVMYPLGGLPLDVRLMAAGILVSVYCFHPKRRFVSRLTIIDVALIGLVIWHIVAESVHEGFDPWIPVRAYGEWALPFVAGWFTMAHRGSVPEVAKVFAAAAGLTALLAIPEAALGMNVWEMCFGPVDDLVEVSRGQRYGLLYRAMGPTRHPIFFGIVLMLMLPWAVALVAEGGARWRQTFGWIALATIALGVMATVSRGPLMALVIASAAAGCFYSIWTRRIVCTVVVAGAIAVVATWPATIDVIDRTENTYSYGSLVEVDGEVVRYTGTRNRLYVVEIYGPLVLRGNAFGFGTTAVSSFPPNIPGLPVSAKTMDVLGIVDNSYILIGLRFGLVGVGLVLVLLIATIVKAFQLAREMSLVTYPGGPGFLVALGSVLVGVCIEMLTVFSSYEFFFWVLFTCGCVSGLSALDLRIRQHALLTE